MTETSRAFLRPRRPVTAQGALAGGLVLLLAAAIGGQVVAWTPVSLTAPWTRIRHSLLSSNDWVLALPDDPKASQLGESSRRSKPSWMDEVADRPDGSVSSHLERGDGSQLPGASRSTSRWTTPSLPRGPPELRSS